MRSLRAVPVLLLLGACTTEAEPQPEPEPPGAAEHALATEEPVASEPVANVIGHVDVAGAVALLEADGEVTVLDVRTPGEFESGHLAGAINVDFKSPDFERELGALDRERTYLVHCATGGRSTKSLPRFEEAGFARVVHLDGGYKAWVAADQPVEK